MRLISCQSVHVPLGATLALTLVLFDDMLATITPSRYCFFDRLGNQLPLKFTLGILWFQRAESRGLPSSIWPSLSLWRWHTSMLRLLVGGLILSTFRRTNAVQSHNILHNRALTSTCRNLNTMETPFEKMTEEGVPKTDKPTEVAAPKKE